MAALKTKANKSLKAPKKVTINDLSENDREIYQEIMESILKAWNVPETEIMDRMKKRKAELKLKSLK